ncbi:hypothetical protein BDQ17DRAFT_1335494 [Cyathus striatus]|nr:hypothetical protein BDQ17DRAFT_1335494 [Cyathus striatus]
MFETSSVTSCKFEKQESQIYKHPISAASKAPIILSDSNTSDHEKTHTHSDALTGGNESDELDGMGAVELKRKLLAEHALWGTHEPNSAADAAEGPGDDHEDTSVNEPAAVDMNAYDAADNTLHMDIDKDGIWNEDDEENDEVESSGIQSHADARHAEISNKYIKAHKRHCNSVVGDDAVLHATHTRHRNKGWHESAHYVPPFSGCYSHLAHRFTKDPDFSKQVARLIAQHLADIRGKLENMANDKVPAIYGLEKLNYDECRKCVHDLMKQTSYIYTGEIDGRKPFQHPAIISLLRDGIFKTKRKPLIADHIHCYKSTVTDGIGKNEFEIPAAMLALIATMVYTCLIDWQTGERNSRSDFSADFLADVYKDHIKFLGNILDGRARRSITV